MVKEKRSPLKSNPLRNPGQSLDEEINKIYDEDINIYLITHKSNPISTACLALAAFSLRHNLNEATYPPIETDDYGGSRIRRDTKVYVFGLIAW